VSGLTIAIGFTLDYTLAAQVESLLITKSIKLSLSQWLVIHWVPKWEFDDRAKFLPICSQLSCRIWVGE
jgi:hypothetical protein